MKFLISTVRKPKLFDPQIFVIRKKYCHFLLGFLLPPVLCIRLLEIEINRFSDFDKLLNVSCFTKRFFTSIKVWLNLTCCFTWSFLFAEYEHWLHWNLPLLPILWTVLIFFHHYRFQIFFLFTSNYFVLLNFKIITLSEPYCLISTLK